MPRTVAEYYGTPNSDRPPGGRGMFGTMYDLGTRYGPKAYKIYKAYREDKEYENRMKRIRQGQQIESQRFMDASQNKKMKGSTNSKAQKALVTRSSMAVSGKTKVKKTRRVKVPSRLAKQIKQVMSGTTARGQYVTIKSGFIGNVITTGVSPFFTAGDDMGKTQMAIAFNRSGGLHGRTLFNQLFQYVPAASTAIVPATGLNYFTPAKILDAASVLFNNKSPGANPYATTGNLSVLSNNATGAPAVVPGQLKVNLLSSWVKFTLKNVSDRVVTVEAWECTPTLKFQNINPLATMVGQIESLSEVTTDTNFQYIFGGNNSNQCFFDTAVDPFHIGKKHMGLKLAWKKRVMVLAPDETCVHSIKGPSGLMDFTKILNVQSNVAGTNPTASTDLNILLKNWSVGVVFGVSGDYVLPTATATSAGKWVFSTTDGALSAPIAVEVQEGYRVAVPEIAGFITQNGIAGTSQQLNARKPKTIVWNQINTGAVAYRVSNEVNPIADVAAAQTN